MSRWLAIAFAIVGIGWEAAAVEPLAQTSPGEVGLSAARLARLTAHFERHVEAGNLTGVVGLIARRGRIAYFESIGLRDREGGEPMARDTVFRIYSMTKPITSVAVMQLYEEGRFLLTDPVSRYLPELADAQVAVELKEPGTGTVRLETVAAERQPTIQDLLRHTSGLTYGFFGSSTVDQMYVEQLSEDETLEIFVRKLGTLPLKHSPGEVWGDGPAPGVLGRLVEVVSGLPLDRYFAERIFAPLGMVDSGFQLPDSARSRLARLYTPDEGGGLRPADPGVSHDFSKRPSFLSGGGGLASTALDYARFAQMLLDGGRLGDARLLSRKTVELMSADHLNGIPGPPFYPGYGFGLGFAVRLDRGVSALPGSVGDFNWAGAAGTVFWIDPGEELIGIFMNQILPGGGRYMSEFRTLTYQAIVD